MYLTDWYGRFRAEVERRITIGSITAKEIAKVAAVHESMISKFRHKGSRLRNDSVDSILQAFGMSLKDFLDLPLDPPLTTKRQSVIHWVAQEVAIHQPSITPHLSRGNFTSTFPPAGESSLSNLDARYQWDRFVAIRVTRFQAKFMHPLFPDGTFLILDRHYQKTDQFFRGTRNIHAIALGNRMSIGYLRQLPDGQFFLDGETGNRSNPEPIEFTKVRKPPHQVVGRVVTILRGPPGR